METRFGSVWSKRGVVLFKLGGSPCFID
jgi:hypothetical protein